MDITKYQNKSAGKKGTITSDFKAGTQMGRVCQVICAGVQHKTMWDANSKTSKKLYWKPKEEQVKGQPNNQTHVDTGNPVTDVVFRITVEFPKVRAINESGEDLGPSWLSKEFGPKSKALIALLEPTGSYQAESLVNMPVMCQIAFTTGGKAKIASIMAAPEGVPVDELAKPAKVFDIYNPDMVVWSELNTWLQDEIKKALDFEKTPLYPLLNASGVNQGTPQQNMSDFDSDNGEDFPPF